MATSLSFGFRIDALVAGAIAGVQQLRQQLTALGTTQVANPTAGVGAGAAASAASITSLLGTVVALGAAAITAGAALRKGLAVNSEMETAALGIKGIIASLQDVRDASGKPAEGLDRLAISGVEAERQLKLLRVAGMQTSAEFADLAKAFQTALGAGSSAGLNVDEIRELTVSLSLAAGAFNLAGDQLSSEIRAMLTGEQVDNSQIAQGLSITGAQIKLWREQGTLVTELNKRLENFKLLGEEAGKSWSATLSNVGDGISLFLGQTSKGAFDALKTGLQNALGSVVDGKTGEIKSQFQGLANFIATVFDGVGNGLATALTTVVGLAEELSGWFDRNNQTVGEIFDAVSRIGAVIGSLVTSFGSLATETASVGSGAKSIRDMFNGVAIVVAVIVDTVRVLAGAIGYVGGFVAQLLLKPFHAVAKIIDRIKGTNYSASIDGITAGVERFTAAAKKMGTQGFAETARVAAEIKKAYSSSPIQAAGPGAAKPPPAGSVNNPGKKISDDAKAKAKKAADAYAEALKSFEDAKADADKSIAKTTRDAAVRDLDASFKLRLISQEKYLNDKALLDAAEIAGELSAAKAKQAALNTRISDETDPAKRKKLEGEMLKLKADIKAIEDKGASVPVALKLQLAEFAESVASLKVEITAELLDQEGRPYEAGLVRLKKKTEDLLNDPRVRGDAELTAGVNKAAAGGKLALDLAQAKRVMDDEAAYYQATQQRIARNVADGKTTAVDAEKELQAAKDKTVSGIKAYITVLESLKAAYPKNNEFALSLVQAQDALDVAKTKTNELGDAISRTFADNAAAAVGDFVTSALSYLDDLRKGTITTTDAMKGIFGAMRDAIRGLMSSLFDDIAKRAQKALADQIWDSLKPGKGGSGGGTDYAALFKGVAGMFGYAGGGHIQGAGTGTSDSIPIWASNGEYMLKASAVRKWGVGFLNQLNGGVMPRNAPKFATGGLIGNMGAAGNTNVNVQNNNSPTLVLPVGHMEEAFYASSRFEREVIRVQMRRS